MIFFFKKTVSYLFLYFILPYQNSSKKCTDRNAKQSSKNVFHKESFIKEVNNKSSSHKKTLKQQKYNFKWNSIKREIQPN